MNEQKQIEKMALTLSEGSCGNECDCIQGDKFNCHLLHSASVLHRAGYRKQEWISVEERLPEDADERVLVYIVSKRSYTELDTDRFVGGRWVRWGDEVTHWMPLPETPKTKGETE
jgi:hypothetical protein